MYQIKFTVSRPTQQKIEAIMKDAVKRGVVKSDEVLDLTMSLCACIAQGCDLNLDALAGFDNLNLSHDLYGIDRHIDKEDGRATSGRLQRNFVPRCAV